MASSSSASTGAASRRLADPRGYGQRHEVRGAVAARRPTCGLGTLPSGAAVTGAITGPAEPV
jgi:hypothetical protein